MEREYLKIIPSDETYDLAKAPAKIAGLYKLSNPDPAGILSRFNPWASTSPPTFEFTVLTEGAGSPVEIYYGVDNQHIESLYQTIAELYPSTFEIERVTTDLGRKLVQPIEYDVEEFLDAAASDALWADIDPEAIPDDIGQSRMSDGDPIGEQSLSALVSKEATGGADTGDTLTKTATPRITDTGTILARPAPDRVLPKGYRFHGVGSRTRDWMCLLTPFSDVTGVARPESYNSEGEWRAPLGGLIETVGNATEPVAFQVVFQRKPMWRSDAEGRIEDLQRREETRFQRLHAAFYHHKKKTDDKLSSSYSDRIEEIESNSPDRTFNVCIRAVAIDERGEDGSLPDALTDLERVFSLADGRFYKIQTERFRDDAHWLTKWATKQKHARRAFERFRNRELLLSESGRSRPQLVLNGGELATFCTVPSTDSLTSSATRKVRGKEQERQSLPRPDPDVLENYRRGMALGYAKAQQGTTETIPTCLPPNLMPLHFAILGSTGAGKSMLLQNALLTMHEATAGPEILVDPKGDGMCKEYLYCHYTRHGHVDDVYYYQLPEIIPAISFFDIRPALAAGRDRATAIQDKVEHFEEMLTLAMGEQRYEQAFVAKEVMTYLIKSLFDPEYGSDAFGLDDLYEAAQQMHRQETLPPISIDKIDNEKSLTRQFERDDRSFNRTMDAVTNRLEQIKKHEHLYKIFKHVPAWDEQAEQYRDGTFDFRTLFDEDAVILLDLGDVRRETQQMLTMVLLSNLWDAVQERRRSDPLRDTNHSIVNLVIDEAAQVASTDLVSKDLLPQGRSFGLSLGLVMQFPEQVQEVSSRAYYELLNNVHSKLIGNINLEDDLADTLANERSSPEEYKHRLSRLPRGEWIADLAPPGFGERGPEPFSLAPLEIPPGHPESEQPINDTELLTDDFQAMIERSAQSHGLKQTSGSEQSTSKSDGDSSESQQSESSDEGTDTPDDPWSVSHGDRDGVERDMTTESETPAPSGGDYNSEGQVLDAVRKQASTMFENHSDDASVDEDGESGLDPDSLPATPAERAADTDANTSLVDTHQEVKASDAEEGDPDFDGEQSPELVDRNNNGSEPTADSRASECTHRDTDDVATEPIEPDPDLFGSVLPDKDDALDDDKDLSHLNPEKRLLKTILDAMNRELADYSLVESMKDLVNRHDDADTDRLLDEGYLEKHRVCYRDYYTVTPKGREYLRESLNAGPGVADLGEKTPHKVGVEILRQWLALQDDVAQTQIYYEHGDVVYDVAAFDADGSLRTVGEIELTSNNHEAICADYKKLAAVDAESLWVFKSLSDAKEVISVLADNEHLPDGLSTRAGRRWEDLRETIESFDAPGMMAVQDMKQLDNERQAATSEDGDA